MSHVSEVSRLLLALGFLPFAWATLHRLRGRIGQKWFLGAYLLVLAADVANIAENYAAPDLLNNMEHGAYAVAGLCLLIAAMRLRAESMAAVKVQP